MNEKIFKEAYQNAYDSVLPEKDSIEKIMERATEEGRRRTLGMAQEYNTNQKQRVRQRRKEWHGKGVLPAATAILVVCILSVMSLPVLAAHVPAVYRILEKYVPDVTDYIVPEESECAEQGIIMRVEGIQLEENHAEIIVSFGNQEGYHHIKGKVDLYDSYHLVSYEGVGKIGGCFFLTYDEEEEKAYFKIDMTADRDFDREKLSFYVGEILTVMGREEKDVDLSGMLYDVPMKKVELRGESGIFLLGEMTAESNEEIQSEHDVANSIPSDMVLDGISAADCAADDFTLTGISYMDGILRVQMCMGDNTDADRHVQLFIKDTEGNERTSDGGVSWFEDVGETPYTFYEYVFLMEEEELENVEMYGIFYNAEESVKGDWKVTFRLE